MPKPQDWRKYAARITDQSGVGALLTPDMQSRAGPPPLLEGLTGEEIARVVAASTNKVLYRGATLFRQGTRHDGIYLIESGRIKVYYTAPTGRELTLAYWHPGNFVGGPDVFDSGVHVWSGIAAQNSSVLHLPGATLRRQIAEIPTLGINVIEGLAFKGRCYSGMAQMLGTRSATERLVHVLLLLGQLYGVEETRGIFIAASFTHADIASMIGTTRQWVTISLTRLTKNGLIGTHHSNLLILQPAALEALSTQKAVLA